MSPLAANYSLLVHSRDGDYRVDKADVRIYMSDSGLFFADTFREENEEVFDFYGPFDTIDELMGELRKFIKEHFE